MNTNGNRSSATDSTSSDASESEAFTPRNRSEKGKPGGAETRIPQPGVDRITGQAIPISETEWQERLAASGAGANRN